MDCVRQPDACKRRGFIIIDALSEGCLEWARKALLHLGASLAISVKRPPPIGLAVLQRKAPNQSTQLQVLLRPASSFQLAEFHACIGRITAAHPSYAADGKTLGGAVKALIEHMSKLPGASSCHHHVFVLSCKFTDHPLLQKVIQLAGPEASQDGMHGALSDFEDQQQRYLMPLDAALGQCIKACAPYASFDHFTADCEAVVDLLCQTWLGELLSSSSSNNETVGADMLLQLDQQQALHCKLQQHLLQLDPWLLPAHLCPCHNIPMHPPAGGSSMATVAAAALGPDSDSATTAGLLALPEEVPWRCGVTGQPVLQDFTCCSTDASILQLGRHTQLKAATKLFSLTGSSSSNGCSANPFTALPLPPGQPCVLRVQHVVGLHEIDSMMIHGMPLVAVPAVNHNRTYQTAAGLAGRQQQQQENITGAESTDDPGMLMRILCQLLFEQQQVLLAGSSHDVHRRCHTPLQQWYLLQPAADGCSLLLRCMATKEQLLPPKGYQGVKQVEGPDGSEEVVLLDAYQLEAVRGSLAALGLCSNDSNLITPHPAAAAAGAAGATNTAAAGATVPCLVTARAQGVAATIATPVDSSSAATGCTTRAEAAATAEGATVRAANATAQTGTAPAVAGTLAVIPATVAAAGAATAAWQGSTGDGNSSHSCSKHVPLMLSCGLHDWVASVLENTTGPYVAPPMPAAPAPSVVAVAPPTAIGAAPMLQPPAPLLTTAPELQQQRQQHGAPATIGITGGSAVGQPPWQQGQQQGEQLGGLQAWQQQQDACLPSDVSNRRRSNGRAGPGTVTRSAGGAAAAAELLLAATPAANRGSDRPGGRRSTGRNALKLSSSSIVPGR